MFLFEDPTYYQPSSQRRSRQSDTASLSDLLFGYPKQQSSNQRVYNQQPSRYYYDNVYQDNDEDYYDQHSYENIRRQQILEQQKKQQQQQQILLEKRKKQQEYEQQQQQYLKAQRQEQLKQQEKQRQQSNQQKQQQQKKQQEQQQKKHWSPKFEIKDISGGVIIRAELPGFRKEDIKLTIKDLTLTVSGIKTNDEPIPSKEDTPYFEEIEDQEIDFINSTSVPIPSKNNDLNSVSKKLKESLIIPKQNDSFQQSFELSTNLELQSISATHIDGILTIQIDRKKIIPKSFNVKVF